MSSSQPREEMCMRKRVSRDFIEYEEMKWEDIALLRDVQNVFSCKTLLIVASFEIPLVFFFRSWASSESTLLQDAFADDNLMYR